ncbi:MAG: hypothetical protein HF978_06325 [Desulfobacteraceae bacterium]|nr:hypothetical protein [Desulfobacteraceae bacterium]MBC2755146.1 hypothetical protein [Desulfobacteraceae bacterium]
MTNFKTKKNAEIILQEILHRLDIELIGQQIDTPIQNAAENFIFNKNTPIKFKQFIEITGKFLQHIYQNGIRLPKKLTDPQAKAEIITLLEKKYKYPQTNGLDTAYVDSLSLGADGWDYILWQITVIIIEIEKTRYINWACNTKIDPHDWVLKHQIARIIITRWKAFLPQHLSNCYPAQLVNHLPELIKALLNSYQFIYNSLTA